jgi:hypothetical protein
LTLENELCVNVFMYIGRFLLETAHGEVPVLWWFKAPLFSSILEGRALFSSVDQPSRRSSAVVVNLIPLIDS